MWCTGPEFTLQGWIRMARPWRGSPTSRKKKKRDGANMRIESYHCLAAKKNHPHWKQGLNVFQPTPCLHQRATPTKIIFDRLQTLSQTFTTLTNPNPTQVKTLNKSYKHKISHLMNITTPSIYVSTHVFQSQNLSN